MKWIVYGAYTRDSEVVSQAIEGPNSGYVKIRFQRKHPGMRVIRVEKAGAGQVAQKEDWYGRTRKPTHRRDE